MNSYGSPARRRQRRDPKTSSTWLNVIVGTLSGTRGLLTFVAFVAVALGGPLLLVRFFTNPDYVQASKDKDARTATIQALEHVHAPGVKAVIANLRHGALDPRTYDLNQIDGPECAGQCSVITLQERRNVAVNEFESHYLTEDALRGAYLAEPGGKCPYVCFAPGGVPRELSTTISPEVRISTTVAGFIPTPEVDPPLGAILDVTGDFTIAYKDGSRLAGTVTERYTPDKTGVLHWVRTTTSQTTSKAPFS